MRNNKLFNKKLDFTICGPDQLTFWGPLDKKDFQAKKVAMCDMMIDIL